jgi:hypothetical protein
MYIWIFQVSIVWTCRIKMYLFSTTRTLRPAHRYLNVALFPYFYSDIVHRCVLITIYVSYSEIAGFLSDLRQIFRDWDFCGFPHTLGVNSVHRS